MPLSAQIRSNITGPGPCPNRPVNTLPLSVRICSGTPCLAQRASQRLAHRPRRRPRHHLRAHDEPGMVIDPGHHLDLGAVSQVHAAHHVHLP